MQSYPTQISMEEGFFALSNSIGMEFLAMEHFQLVKGTSSANGPGLPGLRGPPGSPRPRRTPNLPRAPTARWRRTCSPVS